MIACKYICTYVQMHNIHIYMQVHQSLSTYINICIRTCTYTHMYVYTQTHTYIYIELASANVESLRSDRKDWNIRLKEGDF